jgi:hypothetical protein
MPVPLFSVGPTPGHPLRHQLLSNGVLVGGLLVILLGVAVFIGAPQYLDPNLPLAEIVAVASIAIIFISAVYLIQGILGGGLSTTPHGNEGSDAANADDIEVDRKTSKRSVSTIASSTAGSTVIYHVPSNSLERVVVGVGDIEQALPDTRRN